MPEHMHNYVGGEWVTSETGETFSTINPADPNETVAVYQQSAVPDANAAVEAATEAATDWAETPAPQRGAILTQTATILTERKTEIMELLVREEGKTKSEAGGEVQRAIDIFAYYGAKASDLGGTVKSSSSPHTRLYTTNEPVGVAALITPWNYPIAIPAWKLAPALATGNTVVCKPASLAPGVVFALAEALETAGLPDGVLNIVTGPGSSVGSTFTTHEDVDAVSFTGSTEVGNMVYEQAAPDQKRVQLELGGKNPTVVMSSADLDEAVDIVADGAFGVTGQACTATSRAIVHEDLYDEFVEKIVATAEEISLGPGLDDPDMGPHVTEAELEGTLEYVELGKHEGATLETGGSRAALDEGYFVQPTVFSGVTTEMELSQGEVFGPVLAVISVADFEEGIRVANDVEYGLAASIVTDDLREANRFVDDIEAGVVKINEKTTGLELHVPFGGMKASSSETYREQGDAGLDFYTISKTVYENY